MKRYLSILVAYLFFIFNINAQVSRQTTFRLAFSDSSNKVFFVEHAKVNGFIIEYEKDTPISIALNYRKGVLSNVGKAYDEFYDLGFIIPPETRTAV